MIKLPRLNKQQKEDLDFMMTLEGWRLVNQAIDGSIQCHNAELINWKFKYDENGDVMKKSVREYQEKQHEVGLLKNFLQFLKNPAIVKERDEE